MDNNGKKYHVKSFATFYEDGYFSVTHVYNNLEMSFCDADLQKLYNWKDLYCIQFDPLVARILKLELPKEAQGKEHMLEALGLPIENFLEIIGGDKFALGTETIKHVLEEASPHFGGGNWDQTVAVYRYCVPPYSYLTMRCESPTEEIDINNIANVLSGRENDSFCNSQICDMGVDITAKPDTIMRIYRHFLYTIHKTEKPVDPNVLLFMFDFTDACFVEKIKYISAIKEIRELVYHHAKAPDDVVNQLLDIRQHQLTTLNDGYLYEYRDEHFLTFRAIRMALGMEDYKKEYEQFCGIAEELILKQLNVRKDRERNRQANILGVLTLILTVPSTTMLVDVFYGLEMTPIIYFPPNFAKLIWCGITLLISFGLLFGNKFKQFVLNRLRPQETGLSMTLPFKSEEPEVLQADIKSEKE